MWQRATQIRISSFAIVLSETTPLDAILQVKRRGRSKHFDGVGTVEIEREQAAISDVPEFLLQETERPLVLQTDGECVLGISIAAPNLWKRLVFIHYPWFLR
jgi:hypothetical protein